MTQEEFNQIINQKIFEDNLTQLLTKIAKYPERYVGLFRPTKPYAKIIQNISQSYEIRFGDAVEILFEKYLQSCGFEILPKKLHYKEQDYNIDSLFESQNAVYMVEQKMRDDHDSAKKRGQFANFKAKYLAITEQFPQKPIIATMWFIDDSLQKNKRYYSEEIAKLSAENAENTANTFHLAYGEEFFEISEELRQKSFWDNFVNHLETWKQEIPTFPNVNFDDPAQLDDVLEQISPQKVENKIWLKLFRDERIVVEIFPVIFPTGRAFEEYLRRYANEMPNNRQSVKVREFMNDYIFDCENGKFDG